MKQKPNNPNNERNSRFASYLISIAIHLLVLLLLVILPYLGGDSLEGGSQRDYGAIDVMVMQAEAAEAPSQPVVQPTPPKPQPPAPEPKKPELPKPKPVEVKQPPQEVRPDDVVVPAKEDKPEKPQPTPQEPVKPNIEPEKPVETKPTQPSVSKSQPKQSNASEVQTTGQGGENANNNVGDGKTDHEGTGTSTGPFPKGSFGGMSRVPECKKNDADNDQLMFAYDVKYTPGQGTPIVALKEVTASFDPATIQMTKRILLDSFDPTNIPPDKNVTYSGIVICKCGSNPSCDLK